MVLVFVVAILLAVCSGLLTSVQTASETDTVCQRIQADLRVAKHMLKTVS